MESRVYHDLNGACTYAGVRYCVFLSLIGLQSKRANINGDCCAPNRYPDVAHWYVTLVGAFP